MKVSSRLISTCTAALAALLAGWSQFFLKDISKWRCKSNWCRAYACKPLLTPSLLHSIHFTCSCFHCTLQSRKWSTLCISSHIRSTSSHQQHLCAWAFRYSRWIATITMVRTWKSIMTPDMYIHVNLQHLCLHCYLQTRSTIVLFWCCLGHQHLGIVNHPSLSSCASSMMCHHQLLPYIAAHHHRPPPCSQGWGALVCTLEIFLLAT